jgi:hypothetical protein
MPAKKPATSITSRCPRDATERRIEENGREGVVFEHEAFE